MKAPSLTLFMLALGAILLSFLWQSHYGLNIADEGFLWYGAQRVMVGEVPIRDFMAYDPGRYYWSAALMTLWGNNGIIALRGAIAVFQLMGLFVGLMLLRHSASKQSLLFWTLAAVTLLVWMFPRHKLFDVSLSIALVAALAFLIQRPSIRRYFLTGVFLGLVAVFGRNHGMYGLLGSLCVTAYLTPWRKGAVRILKAWLAGALGVVTGYLPIWIAIALIPGFASAFWDSIRFLFEIKGTNLPLPVPWPWLVPFDQGLTLEMMRGLLIGLFFIAVLAFGVLGIAWVVWQRLRDRPVSPVLVASVFLALPYAHFAYSRADVSHLAQGIFPFLIGSLNLLARQPQKTKRLLTALLCCASLWVMIPTDPRWQCHTSQQCVAVKVSGGTLRLSPGIASDLALLNQLDQQFSSRDRTFIAAPLWPGAYAALGRKAPMWEIFPLFPRSENFERAEIERMKAADPAFAIVLDVPLDGRDELRFRNTHPLTDQYIRNQFQPLTGYTQNPAYQLYKSKQSAP